MNKHKPILLQVSVSYDSREVSVGHRNFTARAGGGGGKGGGVEGYSHMGAI